MKILQILGNLRGGGAERVAIQLHAALHRKGHESLLFVLDRHKSDYDIPEGTHFVAADQIAHRLDSVAPDLILGHMQNGARLLQRYKNDPHIFFVVHTSLYRRTMQKSFLSRLKYRRILRRLYDGANIVTVSEGIRGDFGKLGITPKRVETIYNPFDLDAIRTQAKAPVDMDRPYLLAIGTLNRVKRHDILLRAFAKLDPPIDLVILGEGRLRERLQQLAQRLGIASRVHLKGWVENPYPWIRHAKLLVSSSQAEGFGNVLVEALTLGTPVVSTDCNHGPREILTGALAGYLARVNDPDDLAAKITAALHAYPPIGADLTARFSADRIADRYLSLIA